MAFVIGQAWRKSAWIISLAADCLFEKVELRSLLQKPHFQSFFPVGGAYLHKACHDISSVSSIYPTLRKYTPTANMAALAPLGTHTRPYRDYLTPSLHTRFIRASKYTVLLCYVIACWMSEWNNSEPNLHARELPLI